MSNYNSLSYRLIAWLHCWLLIYALVYSGIHQYSNPAVLPKDCSQQQNHIHKNPEHHVCNLCDYHPRFDQVSKDITPAPTLFDLVSDVNISDQPDLDVIHATSPRAPPIS